MLKLSQDVCEYARDMIQDCRLKSAEIFICDKVAPEARTFYLYGSGVGCEITDRYQRARLFEVDPFTDEMLKENGGDDDDSLMLSSDPRIVQLGARSEDYWRFVSEHRIGVFGAANRRLAPKLYLIVGTHHDVGQGEQAVAVDRLRARIRILQDMVSAELLRALFSQGMGYAALCRAMGNKPALVDASEPKTPLSIRESQIAQLVSEGRQNKEIAYRMQLSEHTIENHLRRIYRKFGIHNRAALAARMSGFPDPAARLAA